MPAYDEVLAHKILLALQEVFPNRVSSHELKAQPPFVELPEEQWLLALDALLKLELIDGKALRAGNRSALRAAANLEITPRGRETLSASAMTDKNDKPIVNFVGLQSAGKWTRKEKLNLIVPLVVAAVVALFCVLLGWMTPEGRLLLHLDKPQEQHAPSPTVPQTTPKTDLLINGIVVDRKSNRELSQVLVIVVGRGKGTTTRDDGSFRIPVPSDTPSVVMVRATKSGYEPCELDVQVPSDGVKLQMVKQ